MKRSSTFKRFYLDLFFIFFLGIILIILVLLTVSNLYKIFSALGLATVSIGGFRVNKIFFVFIYVVSFLTIYGLSLYFYFMYKLK